MIKIRLQRKGRIRRPIYHIVVADSRSPRDGRIIEQVGRYDGVTEKKETVLNEDRIMYWLDTGAQPTDSVRKILRREGLLYKRHLMMWGKSEEEIDAAMSEWRAYRDSKEDTEMTRNEQVKAALAAEEKEFKKQVEKKAEKAAAEVAAEKTVEAEAEAAEEETTEEAVAEETATEETVTEEVAEEVAEETPAEEVADEAPAEETAEATEAATEETPAEEPADETEVAEEETATTDDATEEVAEEAVAEEVAPADAPAEEESSEETGSTDAQTSMDMTAKDAIDHITNTDMDELKGFISENEDRKTVLTAWETKQEG